MTDPATPAAGGAATTPPATGDPAQPNNTELLLRQLEQKTIEAEELRQRVEQLGDSRGGGGSSPSSADVQRMLAQDITQLQQIAASDEPLAPFARVLLANRHEASAAALTVREEAIINQIVEDPAEKKEFREFYAKNRDHFSGPQSGYDGFLGYKSREERKGSKGKTEQEQVNNAAAAMPSGGAAPQQPPASAAPAARADGKQVVAFSWYVKNTTADLIAKKDAGELVIDYNR